MKRFTKLIMLLMVASTLFIGCKEDVTIDEQQAAKYVDMSFDLEALGEQFSGVAAALNKTYINPKDQSTIPYPFCTDEEALTVKFIMDGNPYELGFTALNPSQTEVIQVLAGAHSITEFEVWGANGPIYSAPIVGENDDDIATYGLISLPYDWTANEFTKEKIKLDVICWHEYSYQPLAWNWFELTYLQKKKLIFFGNICSKFYGDWGITDDNYNGYDFVAPIYVKLFSNGIEVASGANYDMNGSFPQVGVGAVKLEYLDNEILTEGLTAEIWVADGAGNTTLAYTIDPIAEGAVSDSDNLGAASFGGADGFWNFQMGNCLGSYEVEPDVVLPAYVPLGTQVIELRAATNSYFKIKPTTAIADLVGGVFHPAWCGNEDLTISYGNHLMKAYSTLDWDNMPANYKNNYDPKVWNVLNYIVNNYGMSADVQNAISGATVTAIQNALWNLLNNKNHSETGNYFAAMKTVSGDKLNLSNVIAAATTYVPPVGGYAVVMLDPVDANGNTKNFQLMVVTVDP